MISRNEALIIAQEEMRKGNMTVAEANVYIIQLEGVHVVTKMDKNTRKALNEAVKNGVLGHIKSEGLKPEVYHHKNARENALVKRDEIARNKINAISKILTN